MFPLAMSDWRNKLNELIEERLAKPELTKDEQQRLDKLNGIAEQLRSGENAHSRR